MRNVILILTATLLATCLAGPAAASVQHEDPATAAPVANPALEGAKEFTTGSTATVIETGLSYNGQRIDFFGSLKGIGVDDVVVKLTSPAETVKINVKGKFGPFWMNTRQYEVENVPAIYKIHATGKLSEILTPEMATKLGIGFPTLKGQLKLKCLKGEEETDDLDTVFNGLCQLKEEEHLYSITEGTRLDVKEDNLFQHYFNFPPGAKPGDYYVETYVFDDDQLVGYSKDKIEIKKVGLVAFVFETSKTHPVLYGISAVLIALATGLLVGFIFKGGGHH